MSTIIPHDDPRISWSGAVSVMREKDWSMPWRLPYQSRWMFGDDEDGLVVKASCPSGVRIALQSGTTVVTGEIVPDTCPPNRIPAQKIDLCIDGTLVQTIELNGAHQFKFDNLPAGNKLIELWLPTVGNFKLRKLELSDGADVTTFTDERPRWITYGSSITHCVAAESPAQTWPGIVARGRGLNLTNLGFGGECFLDILVARLIRDLPAELVSFCAGTNALLKHAFSERVFRYKLIAFIMTIRDGHPDVPIAVMSPIYCPLYDPADGQHAEFWRNCRQIVPEVVERLKAHGDKNLYFVDGLTLLSGDEPDAMRDMKHPNANGYKIMGQRFLENVIPRILP